MAKQCFFTGKRTRAGKRISHAHNVTNRTFEPNLKRVRAMVDGAVKRIWVSTSAIKSGLVVKPPVRNWKPEQPEA
ncbi:MAG: 50S ribosomal protein L28 [Thermoanaerobaculia bacterium]